MRHLLTISDAVATHARLTPNKLGTRDSRRSLSYAQWHERASRLATGLLGLGLNKGDRVGVLAYNCIEWMEIYVALARSGLVAVPLNVRLTAPEMSYILDHSEARAVIASSEFLEILNLIRAEVDIEPQRYVIIEEVSPRGGIGPGGTGYESLIEQAHGTHSFDAIDPDETCALLYTSGTTGRPKGVIRSHAASALMALATAVEMGFSHTDTALIVMPLFHANSLYFASTFLHLGATCIIEDRRSFDPEGLLATLAQEKVTFTSLVPTHYIMVLALPESVRNRYDVSSVGKLLISSAPARQDTKLAILNYFRNGSLYELYGSTEAGWVTLLRPPEQIAKLGSVGREWAGSGAIRLLDEHGREVPDGEVGELFSRTPYVFDGYWKNPEKTAEAFRDGWCSVGDMARRDEDGYIWLVDRKSNMIISGGENIYPSEVENVLGEHPGVRTHLLKSHLIGV
ncbi:MAG: hypothetical protein ETSY1_29745 [Candidatus Entotheonella factor]|uniref:AMP-dependent synthetase/ligase domain-containing protein n=1 Tax=Entotheonella factor TaxID=1429438 RepID=W4LD54_ENTF1|nr:AMP-binding protein [Candidatus Entotheonella palauensis]ETW95655.1 MAG: hypothetical protein ETSY1_29745 [Candidatus Entotheonella factor]